MTKLEYSKTKSRQRKSIETVSLIYCRQRSAAKLAGLCLG